MSQGKFPKRQVTDKTAEIGVNAVSSIVNDDFGWIFRRTHEENDFGVDGYFDYVNEEGGVTGKYCAVQIKTGKSYLQSSGAIHWYSDTKEHLNYFLNLPTSLLLILCDPETKECYWVHLDKDLVELTGERWKYPVPKSNLLNLNAIDDIKNIIGVSADHVGDLEDEKIFCELAQSTSYIFYFVSREDIEKKNIKKLREFFLRVTRKEKTALAVAGKLHISVDGYNDDDRELYQIKEVRKWAKAARKKIDCWFLCAGVDEMPSTIAWLAASTTNINVIAGTMPSGKPGYNVEFNKPKELLAFLDECFEGLNMYSDKWDWSRQLNYDFSKGIHGELFPNIEFPDIDSA